MMRYMKDTLQWASLRYVYLHMAQKGGWGEAERREQKERKKFALSDLPSA